MAVRTAWGPAAAGGEIVSAADIKSIPGGWIGEAAATASQTGITTVTALTGLSVTVTVAANRLLRITGHGRVSRTIADGLILGSILEDGVVVGRWAHHQPSAATEMGTGTGFVLRRPAAGARTYALTLERFSGTGTVALDAAATAPAYITVEDLGPAS